MSLAEERKAGRRKEASAYDPRVRSRGHGPPHTAPQLHKSIRHVSCINWAGGFFSWGKTHIIMLNVKIQPRNDPGAVREEAQSC